jgi:hypothetical protein
MTAVMMVMLDLRARPALLAFLASPAKNAEELTNF